MVVTQDNQVIMLTPGSLYLADIHPLISLITPLRPILAETPRVILLLEFIEKRIERMRQEWRTFNMKF
jgi:hypothetical protein